MSYQVLARKWRPRSFTELVGQTHVMQALVNALDQDRLHHAYLFTGTRGVGKTTIARILAKCLNCEQGVSSLPCGQCAACCEISEGRFIDLIEVDAASRTKVEDTRELLDNVQYAPTRGRFKVYLIDEVHMLSTHSFNALLKTLEEPPEHVKFLLATTDPQKLPVTILSRCLQFGLKNMSPEKIVDHLASVLEQENIPCETSALWHLARAANGSMRDALSLTDQAISYGSGRLQEAEVTAMLGTIDHSQVLALVEALVSGSADTLLSVVSDLAEHAPDYASVLDGLLSVLHRIAVAQIVPNAIDNSQGDGEAVKSLAGRFGGEAVQLYYQIGLIGKRDLPLASDPRSGFEMVLLRMLAFSPEPVDPGQEIPDSDDPDTPPRQEVVVDSVVEPQGDNHRTTDDVVSESTAEAVTVAESLESAEPVVEVSEPPLSAAVDQPVGIVLPVGKGDGQLSLQDLDATSWPVVFASLPLAGVTRTIASHCEYRDHTAGRITLRLDSRGSALFNDTHRQRIETALGHYFMQPLLLKIETGDPDGETPALRSERLELARMERARVSVQQDPFVQQLVNDFAAEAVEESIRPADGTVH